jgi:hypothetical protein
MTTAQVRALFPDFGEDAVNENGPAYMAYKDQNYSGFKTYVADHGSAGFVFIDDCLVGFFIAKPANYEQVLANFRKLYGEPTKFETIADGSEDTTWADGKTQLTVQLKGFEGVFIDAQDYDALVSDFKKHSGHLKQTPKADYVWEIYEGQEYTRGFKSLKAFDEYLAVGNSRALAVRSRMDHGSEVCTINPHTKLKALKYDPNRTLMFAKILDGKRKNQFWWVSKDFIDRL